jgi:hypothetical protein
MLKDLLRSQLRQLWLGSKPSSAAEAPAYGQTQAWQARMNGADDHHMASGQGKGHSFSANPCDVLATARAASGM